MSTETLPFFNRSPFEGLFPSLRAFEQYTTIRNDNLAAPVELEIELERRLPEIAEDCDEDFLAPTGYAERKAKGYLKAGLQVFQQPLPFYLLTADGEGGLVAVWRRNDKNLRVFFRADERHVFYLYFGPEGHQAIDNPSIQTFVEKLNWLMS